MKERTDRLRIPDEVSILRKTLSVQKGAENCAFEDVRAELILKNGVLSVWLEAKESAVRKIVLCWKGEGANAGTILSDCWERSYGDMEWREAAAQNGERAVMPWYFLNDQKEAVRAYGVQVRAGAMCWWELKGEDLLLHLDVRNGGCGVQLNGRRFLAASVLMKEYREEAFTAAADFCGCMCEDSIYDGTPVYGANNWYYAYGNSSRESLLADAAYLADMTEGILNRPFMVIDDGWQSRHTREYNGGPWESGNEKHGDMGLLAREMKKLGVRPGIWFRPLLDSSEEIPGEWRLKRAPEILDISVPEVREHIRADLQRIAGWGYELVKHDFSTFDIFGKWGFQMGSTLTEEGWHFKDTSRTTAELIVDFYRDIREAAGDMLILGCNCIGHLGAGLMHLNRIGDDTSGVEWERTRKMGVNTLAFRMPQHQTFFGADADCVGITEKIAWEKNRQWMELLSKSGTPFFVSVKPGTLTEEQEKELKKAYQAASAPAPCAVPLNWKKTTVPDKWKLGEETGTFSWF